MTDKNKHIPQGYKDSPLGIIPKEWEVKRLGDFCISFSGGTPRSGTPSYYNGTIPFIRSGEINQDKTELFISQEGLDNSSAKLVQKGDILYALYGANSGQCSLSKINGVINQAILCIRPNAHPYFLMSVLQFNKNHYYNSYLQGGQGNLSGEIVSNYRIALPSTEEQERICSVLQLWDTAIEKQSELIAKLKLRKRALMQQLLTGKKRLPGFNGEWKKVKLGSIAEIVGGGTPNTNISHYWNGGIPWFTPTEIGKTKYVSESKKTISAHGQNNSSAKILPKGTILFTSRATIGAKAILTVKATTNQGFQSLIVHNGNNNEFIYYYLDIILKGIKQKASGSTFAEVSAESIRKIEIIIPPKEEQNVIASIFINADKEIELPTRN